MKKYYTFLLLLLVLLLTGCNKSSASEEYTIPAKNTPRRIVLATDLHYLSSELFDHGELMKRLVRSGDGKVIQYTPQITDAFLDEIQYLETDLLILSGDLTFNGERKSHEELAGKLAQFQESGIPVLVIPGNHDLDNPFSRGYEKDKYYGTPNISGDDFLSIYNDFGYSQAISKDENTLSYVYPYSSDLWFMMIDVNTKILPSAISQQTFDWIETQMSEAKKNNITVITVTHQNMLSHNEMFQDGYVIHSSRDIAALYKESNVKLNLSGHMHVQHIAESPKGYYDIATSSLAVSPNQYGILDLDDKHNISYFTKQTEVSVWAKKTGIKDSNLKNFEKYSKDTFDQITFDKISAHVNELNLSTEEKKELCQLITDMNYAYFSGTLWEKADMFKNNKAYQLLEQYKEDNFFISYMYRSINEVEKTENQIEIQQE